MKINLIKILKISIGCCASVFCASLFGLSSSTSAGIITLMTIQDTKKETFRIALRRLSAFLLSLAVAYLTFFLLGFSVISFGVFLFSFILICYLLNLHEGVPTSTVLVSHIWAFQSIASDMLINETLLLLIGTGIGILINLYMPKKLEQIKADQQSIDNALKAVIEHLALLLTGTDSPKQEEEFHKLERKMEQALATAYENQNNTLTKDMRYYVSYIKLRMEQLSILREIYNKVRFEAEIPAYAYVVAGFLNHVSNSFHEYNNAAQLSDEFYAMVGSFRSNPLPTTHDELEAYAVLYHILFDLEQFILVKKQFAASLSQWEIDYFWS